MGHQVFSPIIRDADFQRIVSIPRREELADCVAEETSRYRRPGSSATLFRAQAVALRELRMHGGLFGMLPIGSGKTLISLLAPTVLQKRALIVVPAALRKKTHQELVQYAKDWLIGITFRIKSYEELSRVSHANFLEDYRPELLVFDEAHRLKNRSAAVTKRITRYFRQHPDTQSVCLSGTITTRSLTEYAHLLIWTLKNQAPVPLNPMHVQMWASHLDARAAEGQNPGCLLDLSPPHPDDTGTDQAKARARFRRRLLHTPAVQVSQGSGFTGSLVVNLVAMKDTPQELKDVFDDLQKSKEIPDYLAMDNPLEYWQIANQLCTGLIYYWDPPPPKDWSIARKVWYASVRETLKRSRTYDSPQQVEFATRGGQTDLQYQLEAWDKVKNLYHINVKAKWIGEHMIDACRKYKRGIIWCNLQAASERIAKELDVPYYGSKGEDHRGRRIEDATGLIVASIDANSTGRNLQQFSHNVVVTSALPSSTWAQLIGRTHRHGQKTDTVTVDVLIPHAIIQDSFDKALKDAKYAYETTEDKNKLLIADIIGE